MGVSTGAFVGASVGVSPVGASVGVSATVVSSTPGVVLTPVLTEPAAKRSLPSLSTKRTRISCLQEAKAKTITATSASEIILKMFFFIRFLPLSIMSGIFSVFYGAVHTQYVQYIN